jgi:hypothetical protein
MITVNVGMFLKTIFEIITKMSWVFFVLSLNKNKILETG